MEKDLSQEIIPSFAGWFSGKTALVTGATSGIGREFAKLLASYGCRVLACGRNKQDMKSLLSELNKNSGIVSEGFIADLSSRSSRQKLIKKISQTREVDVLINNAGFGHIGDFCLASEELIDSMREVNMNAVVDFSREFLPKMIKKGCGGILNVGSTASFFGTPGSGLYGATKHFVLGFTDALHQEALSYGVHVTGIYPGHTHSRFVSRATEGKTKKWEKGMSPVSVAKSGLQGLSQNKTRVVPGLYNKALFVGAKIMPTSFILEKLYEKFSKNHK